MEIRETTLDELMQSERVEDLCEQFLRCSLIPEHYANGDPVTAMRNLNEAYGAVTVAVGAFDGNVCAGMAVGTLNMDIKGNCMNIYMHTIFVREEYRGGSLGGRILALAKRIAKSRGCTAMMLSAVHGSEMSRGFAKRMKQVFDIYYGGL